MNREVRSDEVIRFRHEDFWDIKEQMSSNEHSTSSSRPYRNSIFRTIDRRLEILVRQDEEEFGSSCPLSERDRDLSSQAVFFSGLSGGEKICERHMSVWLEYQR